MADEQKIFRQVIQRKGQYFCWVSRPASMQRLTLLVRAFNKCLNSEVINFRGQGRDLSYYFEKAKYRRVSLNLEEKLNSETAINKHFSDYRRYKKRLLKVGERAKKIKADKGALLALFNEYEMAMLDFAYYLISPFFIDDYIFPDLAKRLKEIIAPEKYDEALEIISTPTIVFGYQKYHQALARVKGAADYKKIATKYQWVKEYSFQEKLLDAVTAQADRRELLENGLLKAALQASRLGRNNQKRLNVLLAGSKDKKIKRQIKLVHNYVNVKTERIEVYKMFQANFRQFFHRLLELVKRDQLKTKYEDIISLTDEEILDFLRRGRQIDLNITAKRFNLEFVSVSQKGKMVFTYNKALIKEVRQAFMTFSCASEIKGAAVSRGKVSGRVRLIMKRADLNKIKTGEILVANFTMPDYVPAMKKAAGIITDDGGITSHAAIISRELGKPCVTGTKFATQVLQNGDLVEIDGEKGIVKIIKK